jgi:hypothetical protein
MCTRLAAELDNCQHAPRVHKVVIVSIWLVSAFVHAVCFLVMWRYERHREAKKQYAERTRRLISTAEDFEVQEETKLLMDLPVSIRSSSILDKHASV